MSFCEFLIREDSRSCVACTGWFCTSLGRKKKLSDAVYCRDHRDECPRFLKVYPKPAEERETVSTDDYVEPVSIPEKAEEEPVLEVKPKTRVKPKKVVATRVAPPIIVTPPSTDCPYLGPIPPGECGCCDVWCYATSEPLRSFKHCKSPPSWRECRFRIQAERAGVKHASA